MNRTKVIEEIGSCPKCGCAIVAYKTSNYKRFAKCESCGASYSLPKSGKLSNSAELCPKSGVPVLIVEKAHQPAYFWADCPCFACVGFDKCAKIKELTQEFKELKVYGY